MGAGGSCHAPAALPLKVTQYPYNERQDEPQSRSGLMRKISPPPVFDARTVQPVTSSYTN